MDFLQWFEDFVHGLRYREVMRHLKASKRLADLGSGNKPRFLLKVRHLMGECWGLDPATEPLDEGNLHVRKGDVTQALPFDDGFLDQVTCLAVIEHVDDPLPILRECRRCLEPGGRLILTTPSRFGIYVHELLRLIGMVRDVKEGEHRDFNLWPRRLAGWARDAGFEVEVCETFELGLNVILVARKP